MKQTREQKFCTQICGRLKVHPLPHHALIEAKVVDEGKSFRFADIRKGQWGALYKCENTFMPIVHKISDGGVGSKLVDIVFISPYRDSIWTSYVAIKFIASRKSYLVPFAFLEFHLMKGEHSLKETWLDEFRLPLSQ